MIFSKTALLSELCDRIDLIRKSAGSFSSMYPEQLNWKPGEQQWSILEVFEHLNISHSIYLKSIVKEMELSAADHSDVFKSGWLGDWIYEKILPRDDGRILKMKTPSFLQPKSSGLDVEEVFSDYYNQLDTLEGLMERAHRANLQKIKIPLSFTTLLKLRLGDNFRFLVAHHERHLMQANRVSALFHDNSTGAG